MKQFILIVLLILILPYINADVIDVGAGTSYYLVLDSFSDTPHWAGYNIQHTGADLDDGESNLPFVTIPTTVPIVATVSFPGSNLLDDLHYYAALQASTFSTDNVINMSPSDLDDDELFDSTNFPTFYPGYDSKNDNPDSTFCCTTAIIPIGGINFSAYEISIGTGIDYYLLKYNDSGTFRPLFLVEHEVSVCYNATLCYGQLIVPISPTPYNFFSLSKVAVYNITVFVDGVETLTLDELTIPYNVTLSVTNTYSGAPGSSLPVYIAENTAKNIFVPVDNAGYESNAYVYGLTDVNGLASFLITPTGYQSGENYSIYVGVLTNSILSNRKNLVVDDTGSLPLNPDKLLNPVSLSNNAKASVNQLNSIASFMSQWANFNGQAKRHEITYDIGTNSWDFQEIDLARAYIELKTGAPNTIQVFIENFGISQAGYTANIVQEGGHMLLSPYTGTSPLTESIRVHSYDFPSDTLIVVTPTSIGTEIANITLTIYNAGGFVVNSTNLSITDDLNIDPSEGLSYNNNQLKTAINAMNSIASSQFVAIN